MTRRQIQVLTYIRSYIEREGIPPSRREICAGCGLRSTSQANAAVEKLIAHGRIKRIPNRARAIELVTSDWERVVILERENTELRKMLEQYQGVEA